jgi:hypothetical protein
MERLKRGCCRASPAVELMFSLLTLRRGGTPA